jgi:hypothetical protein
MDVTIHTVERKGNGWLITLRSQVQPSMDREKLRMMEDREVTLKGDEIYLKNYFDLSEPWEDGTLEYIIESAILEGKWKLNRLQDD